MKLIIDIPEGLFEAYKGRPPMLGDAGMDMIAQAIANGIPLPKGHGRLIDADALDVSIENRYADMELDGYDPFSLETYAEMVDSLVETAPTIIEADKETENE